MALDNEATYYDVGGIETIEILRAKLTMEQYEGFLLGNILKYACRFGRKGSKADDARKLKIYAGLLEGMYAVGYADSNSER